jgi:hypothetical protein
MGNYTALGASLCEHYRVVVRRYNSYAVTILATALVFLYGIVVFALYWDWTLVLGFLVLNSTLVPIQVVNFCKYRAIQNSVLNDIERFVDLFCEAVYSVNDGLDRTIAEPYMRDEVIAKFFPGVALVKYGGLWWLLKTKARQLMSWIGQYV